VKPRLLDLFCKAGGASMGYHRAGFEVVGVDIEPQPHYPFEFIQADALEKLADKEFIAGFDAVAGSPPCQSESDMRHRTGIDYEDFLTPTLELLAGIDKPWVVENVASTKKMPGSLILCGTEFGLKARCRGGEVRWLSRHRRFGSNVFLLGAGGCHCTRGKLIGGVYGTGGGGPMNRGYKFHAPEGREAMGIDWMTWPELSQAIPPAYTEFIGRQLVAALEGRAVA
jgi:DNA (cytosine-5)-methyltransferase 1